MKKLLCIILSVLLLAGCTAVPTLTETAPAGTEDRIGEVLITLSDENIGVDYSTATTEDSGVVIDNDIVYYEAGHDFTYGEGTEDEAHTAEEAAAHTVVHITKPGVYRITGKLSLGQIAVDLGDEAEEDPNALVTLILDGADITCTVAPAVIFYNVYECGDADNPINTVDTSAAGANVILADGSVNNITGSHVARIYKPDSVELSEDGTEVVDSKKLHKYDAAFYSKMSMNVSGNDGVLNIDADNEGLDSELHLTINGGNINISSGNDGINTNEDGISVTTVNGGHLRITVTGTTGEGDGIDSNGWLVINGGIVEAYACSLSGDAGIDSDMGISINGGVVCATGNMLDRIEDGGQTHIVFTFAQRQEPGTYTLKDAEGNVVVECESSNAFQYLILSSPDLAEATYTLWSGETQYQGLGGLGGMGGVGGPGGGGFIGGQPGQIERPDWPEQGGDVEIPPQPTQPVVTHGEDGETVTDGQTPTPDMSEQSQQMPIPEFPEGDPGQMPVPEMPEGAENMPMPEMPEGGEDMPVPELPDGVEPPADGDRGRQPWGGTVTAGELTTEFTLNAGANYFINVAPVE